MLVIVYMYKKQRWDVSLHRVYGKRHHFETTAKKVWDFICDKLIFSMDLLA